MTLGHVFPFTLDGGSGAGRYIMRKLLVIAALLLGLLGGTMRVRAAQEQLGTGIRQKISKTAKKLAPQAAVFYRGAPQFAPIEGTSIANATNTPQVVLHIGDAFYFLFTYYYPLVHNTRDVWLISTSARGPWVPAHFLPEVIPELICEQVNVHPSNPYQLCALPWTSGLIYATWEPSWPSSN